ncbi:DedA family protein [Fictibacillus sp. Mic-4]|uniref:DedA family protein n=1 Tax=Fictibacillus TaxID=1329200 RepID=UPI0004103B6D|nr:DedA family protein [Fictibacillus gelatini]
MEQNILHFIQQFEYIGIFLALALGILGLPIPDEALMTFAGYLVYKNMMSYFLTIFISSIGALTGITISYWIGRRFGLPLITKFGPKLRITEDKLLKTQGLFQKYGTLLIVFGYFIPGIRHITAYLAGISSMSFKKYVTLAYAGIMIWCVTFVTLGRELGKRWMIVDEYVHRFAIDGILLILFIAIIYFIIVKTKKTYR